MNQEKQSKGGNHQPKAWILGIAGLLCVIVFVLLQGQLDIGATLIPGQQDYKTYTQEELGPVNHYNGVVFGNLISVQADVEGAMAIGGRKEESDMESYAQFGTSGLFDIGAAYVGSWNYSEYSQMGKFENPDSYPVVMVNTDRISLGGTLGNSKTSGNAGSAYGGHVVLTENNVDEYTDKTVRWNSSGANGGGVDDSNQYKTYQYYTDSSVLDEWFENAYNLMTAAAKQYEQANDVSITEEEFANGKYYQIYDASHFLNQNLVAPGETEPAEKVLVINVQTKASLLFSSSASIKILGEWANTYDLIIFNFPDAVTVSDGSNQGGFMIDGLDWGYMNYPPAYVTDKAQLAMRNNVASKCVYNFPNAENITLEGIMIYGSVIAPNADFHAKGGSLNGQLICKNMYQEAGFELHAYRLSDRYLEIPDPDVDPDPDLHNVQVTKRLYFNGERETLLEGAEFALYKLEDEKFVPYLNEEQVPLTFVTDQYGSYFIEDLPVGTYRLEELAAPANGLLNTDDPANAATYYRYEFTISDTDEVYIGDMYSRMGPDGTIYIERYNIPQLFPVWIHKVDEEEEDLEDAVFTVYRLPDDYLPETVIMVPEWSTGADGLIRMELPAGSYRIVEVTAPKGFELLEGSITFTVADDGRVINLADETGKDCSSLSYEEEMDPAVHIITIQNHPGIYQNIVTLNKVDAENERVLAGAEFELYLWDNGQWIYMADNDLDQESEYHQSLTSIVTDENGRYLIRNLQPGRYRLIEVKVPQGYVNANTHTEDEQFGPYAQEFTVEAKQADEDSDLVESVSVTIENSRAKAGIRLQKVSDVSPHASLMGARFVLYRVNEGGVELIKSDTTDAEGRIYFDGLTEGRYLLMELSALSSHKVIIDDIYFRMVWQDDEIRAVSDSDLDQVRLYPTEGEDADAYPDTIEITNKAYLADLKVYKREDKTYQVGQEDLDGSGREVRFVFDYLEGAVFRVERRDSAGNYLEYAYLGPTEKPLDGEEDDDGNEVAYAVLEGLPEGTYRLIEVTAPEGYESKYDEGEGLVFSIGAADARGGVEIELMVTNSKKVPKSTIKVQKIDREDGRPLAGVEFRLWKMKEGAEEWGRDTDLETVAVDYNTNKLKVSKYAAGSEYITGEDGYLYLNNLEPGVYALSEVVPPEDYLFVLDPRATIVGSQFSLNYYYHLTVFKVTAVDEKDLEAGVRIQWVHEPKIETDEARFSNDVHDVPNDEWDPQAYPEYGERKDGSYDLQAYRSLQITNRKVEIPDIVFEKVDGDTGAGLADAAFTLYWGEKQEDGSWFFDQVFGTYLSDSSGTVAIAFTDAQKEQLQKQMNGENTTLGRFKLAETAAPPGYDLIYAPIYFEIAVHADHKAAELYELNEDGSNVMADSGTVFGQVKKALATSYIPPENGGEKGTYTTVIKLDEIVNYNGGGGFVIRKELTEAALEQEAFLFRVGKTAQTGEEEVFYGTIFIEAGQSHASISFTGLSYGTYLIEELDTNWRYTLEDQTEGSQIFELNAASDGKEVVFRNQKDTDSWRSDKSSVINHMEEITEGAGSSQEEDK